MLLLFRFFVTFCVALVTWYFVPGFVANNFYELLLFSVILSAVNAIIRPVLTLLTLPITILTLGLFSLVINIVTFGLALLLSYGVYVETFSALIWGGTIMWITSIFLNRYIWHVNIY